MANLMRDDEHAQDAHPLRRDAAQNRRRVLDAATAVFCEQGLDASVEEIARSAGVGMGTLYRRFPTKEALIDELVRDLLERVVIIAQDCLGLDSGGLEAFFRRTCEIDMTHRGCQERLWQRLREHDGISRARVLVLQLLERAQANGEVALDVTYDDVSMLFVAMSLYIESMPTTTLLALNRYVDIMVAGLRPIIRHS